MTTVEKRQKRASIFDQMKSLNEAAAKENRSLNAEEQGKWDKMDAEMRQLKADIDKEERMSALDKEMADTAGEQRGTEEVQVESRAAFDNYLRRGYKGLNDAERRALEQRAATDPNSTTDGEGGFLVPEYWAGEVERVMKDFSGVLNAARVIPRSNASGTYNHPVINDTTNLGALLGEGVTDAVNQFTDTNVKIPVYTYTSRIIKLTLELIQDAGYNVTQEVLAICAERVGRILNNHFTVGTGSGQPQGVAVGAGAGLTAASATVFTKDELIDLLMAVDASYRTTGTWMFNDSTLAAIMKMDVGSSDDRPLWLPSIAADQPDTILGKPYVVNNDMPAVATGTTPILFGDMSKYVISAGRTPELVTFREKYMDERCVGYNMFARYGGAVVNNTAIKKITMA